MSPISKVVFDASALLAVLRREPAGERLSPRLGSGIISAVTLAEVTTILGRRGLATASVFSDVCKILNDIRPLDVEQARLLVALDEKTKLFALSLGERACLALGLSTGFPVLTTNPVWEKLDLGVSIEVIRNSMAAA